jgi:hypothetical protein
MAVIGIDRKCRRCGKWHYFKNGVDANRDRCPECGAEYGHVELGLDATRFAGPKPKLPKALQMQATKLPKPKPGEYGGD